MPATDGFSSRGMSRCRVASSLGPAIHLGEILLEEFLKPLEMTQAAAA